MSLKQAHLLKVTCNLSPSDPPPPRLLWILKQQSENWKKPELSYKWMNSNAASVFWEDWGLPRLQMLLRWKDGSLVKSAGNWFLCKVIIVMNTHLTVLTEISMSCLYFKVLRPLEGRFFRDYVICVIKGIYWWKQ